jgi:hypothetical protein
MCVTGNLNILGIWEAGGNAGSFDNKMPFARVILQTAGCSEKSG